MIEVKQMSKDDIHIMIDVLTEATNRMTRNGTPMWTIPEINEQGLLHYFKYEQMYVGFKNGVPCCTFVLLESDDLYWGEAGKDFSSIYLHKISVADAFIKQGVVKEILDFAEEVAKERGKTALRLDVRATLSKVKQVYENNGFKYFGTSRVYLKEVTLDVILLEKTL